MKNTRHDQIIEALADFVIRVANGDTSNLSDQREALRILPAIAQIVLDYPLLVSTDNAE